MFLGYILSSAGRHDLSLQPYHAGIPPQSRSIVFPGHRRSAGVSWVSSALGIVGFLIAVKRLAILPAPLQEWHDMASYFRFRRPYIRWTGYFKYGLFRRRRNRINRILIERQALMAKRITIDPITRIEGHLRIDVEVDNNAVSNAWASCTMWRGIEKILRGRDPRDAWLFTQRFCGVCTTVHAMASVRAVEDALSWRFR